MVGILSFGHQVKQANGTAVLILCGKTVKDAPITQNRAQPIIMFLCIFINDSVSVNQHLTAVKVIQRKCVCVCVCVCGMTANLFTELNS